jgi:hypothetical protein
LNGAKSKSATNQKYLIENWNDDNCEKPRKNQENFAD